MIFISIVRVLIGLKSIHPLIVLPALYLYGLLEPVSSAHKVKILIGISWNSQSEPL